MVIQRFNPSEYEAFKREVRRIDKKSGNAAAIWFMRGAVYLNKLDTKMQVELIGMILAG